LLLAVSPIRIAIRSTLVYDMYPWDDNADSAPPRRRRQEDSPAIRAVQFALDRRDNGGDALSEAGQPATRQSRQ
jgi:hypothetical protein